jgi:PqqD family protein of HPr-rel-A system
LLWRRWDQEFVVFDPRSGDIHLLDSLAAEILRRLDESSATVAELSRELDVSLGHEAELDLAQYVAKLVGELDELGLIEPASVDVR